MKFRQVVLLIGVSIASFGPVACHKDERDPCQKLAAQQVKCDFDHEAALDDKAQEALVDTCRKTQNTLLMRTAIDCLKAKECRSFLTCRKEANELKGLKTDF